MASPFSVFRRNQRIMLAVFGVVLMISFLFLDPRIMTGGGGGDQNPVVVEGSFGTLREAELYHLVRGREYVRNFLRRLVEMSIVSDSQMDPRLMEVFANQKFMQEVQPVLQRFAANEEARAVETLLLAERAEELGVTVSDEAVRDYIHQVAGENVTTTAMRELMKTIHENGRPITEERLFDALRRELMAFQLHQIFVSSLNAIPPGQRWEYFLRLNREAIIEFAAVPVVNFIEKVGDPSEAQLQAFFDEYKEQYSSPASPDPGFRQAPRAQFQWFKLDYDEFLKRAKEQVTEQEIRDYYEKNKDREFMATSPAASTPPAGTAAPGEASPDANPDAGTETPPAATDTPPAATDPQPDAAGETPTDETPASPKEGAAPTQPATDAPAVDESPARPDAKTDNKSDNKNKKSAAASRPRMILVSANNQDEKQPAEPADAAAPADAPPATDDQPAPADSSAAEPPAATDEAPASDGEKTTEVAGDDAAPAAETPKYRPLEQVQDEIRDRLAGQKVRELMEDTENRLVSEMRKYRERSILQSTQRRNQDGAAPLPGMDVKKLAEEQGVAYRDQAEMMTPMEMQEKTDLGKSYRAQQVNAFSYRPQYFWQFAFGESLPALQPETTEDTTGSRYVFWKVKEADEYVPTLDEVRKEVVRAWKMMQARELAKKHAEALAEKVRDAQRPMEEIFADNRDIRVGKAGPFTWLTMGDVAEDAMNQPRITNIEDVDYAGEDFMRTVFNLNTEEVGVAMNQPETVAYAIKPLSFSPPLEELREMFASRDFRQYYLASLPDQRAIYQRWIATLEVEEEVNWVRPPRVEQRRVDSE